MDRFEISHDLGTVTVRQSQNNLFSIDLNKSFIGYIAKKGDVFKLQPSSKMPEDMYLIIVDELKEKL